MRDTDMRYPPMLQDVCREKNISTTSVKDHMRIRGMSLSDAVDLVLHNKKRLGRGKEHTDASPAQKFNSLPAILL
ncbi:MAG: hypothetical protein DRI97_17260 [Bacteroidetes bacterium]|nr:MAG: hypothetical protein DRI97_17260 [Bacteroidota bacterium]